MDPHRWSTLALAVACVTSTGLIERANATETSPLPLAGIVIALDPGHNGGNASHPTAIHRKVFVGNGWKACNTVGTTTRSGYAEHRVTFNVAKRVKARLEALGATVFLTRNTDRGVGPCVNVRGRFGQKVHAATSGQHPRRRVEHLAPRFRRHETRACARLHG